MRITQKHYKTILIMSGVYAGQGAVIAAGSAVTKDILLFFTYYVLEWVLGVIKNSVNINSLNFI